MIRPTPTAVIGLLITAPWLASFSGVAAETPDFAFFEKHIRPVLVERCYQCHSADAEKIEGEFLLDTRAGIRKGGASGRDAVIPGDARGSQLVEAIRYGNEDLQMPPKHALPESVVADFEKWITDGAADPRDGIAKLPRDIAAEDHWGFQPPVKPALPNVEDAGWPVDRIDSFVLSKLEAEGLGPVADADRRTLIRRATIELTGLPPTPEEIDAFLADAAPDREAFAAVVDRLLASPQFGVRWGRHWLDVARYAESSGFSRNMLYPHAWRYRNYVIDAFNDDKPYDEFVREQIAGDLLGAATPEESDERAIATGFLAIGPRELNEGTVELFHLNVADDQIDATCRAFLGLTVNCARCHDHKYDPIPTRDYYALAGIFLSSQVHGGVETNVRGEHGGAFALGRDGSNRLERIAEAEARAVETQKIYMEFVAKRNAIREPLEKAGIDWRKNPTPALAAAEAIVQEHQDLVKAAKAAIPGPPEYAMAVVEGKIPGVENEKEDEDEDEDESKKKKGPLPSVIHDAPVYEKGNHEAPLDTVPRGFLTLFPHECAPIGERESGRRQLADWITDEGNPLTARVMVNRIWHHLFGLGLVETVDNFGVLGAKPSHPELLDDLALRFMEEGWSMKRMIRAIMLSRTYRLSAAHDAKNGAVDPGNRLVWRFAPRRLEGEVIRDSILFAGGQLELAPLEGSQVADIAATQPKALQREIGRRDFYTREVRHDVRHRSVYLPMARSALYDFLTIFDAADPNLVVGARKLTTVPAQALFLMNSPLVLEQAKNAAERVLERPERERIGFAHALMLGRTPTEEERARFEAYLMESSETEMETWAELCQTLFCSGEFRMVY